MSAPAPSAGDAAAGPGDDSHDYEENSDERTERIRDTAQRLAALMLDPMTNSAQRRNEIRKEAYEALSQCIDALAAMCDAASAYSEAMYSASAVLGDTRPPEDQEQKKP